MKVLEAKGAEGSVLEGFGGVAGSERLLLDMSWLLGFTTSELLYVLKTDSERCLPMQGKGEKIRIPRTR